MSWLQRYLDIFQGEPVWLVVLVSIVILAGVFVILEKVMKLGIWLLIAGVVAAVVIFLGLFFVPGCGVGEDQPVEVQEERVEPLEPEEVPERSEVPFQTPSYLPE